MINHVIFGLLVVSCTFSSADIHHFMEMMIRKFLEVYKKVNLILMAKSGMKCLRKQKIWLKNLLQDLRKDWQLKRPWTTNGLNFTQIKLNNQNILKKEI
jgi:hypothetical protein